MDENDGIWISILKENPSTDGLYYTYVFNESENCNEITKMAYQNLNWVDSYDKKRKVIAWKEIRRSVLGKTERDKWIKEHEDIICTMFLLDSLCGYHIEVVETFIDCVYEHEWFLINGYIKYIDGLYVLVFC